MNIIILCEVLAPRSKNNQPYFAQGYAGSTTSKKPPPKAVVFAKCLHREAKTTNPTSHKATQGPPPRKNHRRKQWFLRSGGDGEIELPSEEENVADLRNVSFLDGFNI